MDSERFTGPRHPQSTRPMTKGRPLFKGDYRTRAEFLAAVAERVERGWTVAHIAHVFKVRWRTAKRAIDDAKGAQGETL